jgi:hypothetical protein
VRSDTGGAIESVILANVLGERRRRGWASPVRRVDCRDISNEALKQLKATRRSG